MSATTATVGTVVRALPCEYHDLIKITGRLYQVGRIDQAKAARHTAGLSITASAEWRARSWAPC